MDREREIDGSEEVMSKVWPQCLEASKGRELSPRTLDRMPAP
jgi:hypothetical protein